MKTLKTDTLRWTLHIVTVDCRAELMATRDGPHFLAALTGLGQQIDAELQRRNAATEVTPAVLQERCAAQDTALRTLMAHLAAIEIDQGLPEADVLLVATVREAISLHGANPKRSHTVRAVEGESARVALAGIVADLARLPALGGKTVADRVAVYLEASAACRDALTATHQARSFRAPKIAALRLQALRVLGDLRTALRAEARVNPAFPAGLETRLFSVADEVKASRRAKKSGGVVPVTPPEPAVEAESRDSTA